MLTILQATRKILSLAKIDPKASSLPVLIDFVNRFGTVADANALYELFQVTKDSELLDPIMFHGDADIADDLFKHAISNGELDTSYPSETLLALAYLQHPEMEAILIRYYQDLFAENTDWDLHIHVCLGLLNYNCKGYEEQLRTMINRCLETHLFPDLIPIIAYKLGNQELNERLIKHALEEASTSCISGILLSTALAGKSYREVFKSMILNKDLEATYSGIGNTYFTFQGMHAQQISIRELYEDFLMALKAQDHSVEDRLNVLYDLMEVKLGEPVQYAMRGFEKLDESIESLNRLFFVWKDNPNKDETIIGLISDYAKKNPEFENKADKHKQQWYNLQDHYRLKLENQVLLDLVAG
jgi:hypothetical protein